ncbi:hypothetical protein SAMN02745673_00384 [Marinactinospora thermotolerans DSM 45154]|uniref:Uncharacterized protein n=1 Tax=Marinactinospora thermotolerans DSM 45154 TaxID=1122192 RepID=A0A1T4KHT9_9ACTN|nr:hypothetical protein [Marinactinospora thermotolerans]SJZ41913.1 hypothetical protein SAMN02745673_00384 [Marinactinospora thermotolerans DSM 45154]
MSAADLLDPTGPNRSLRPVARPTTYRVAADAQPRRVRRAADGTLWGEVPVVPVVAEETSRHQERTELRIAVKVDVPSTDKRNRHRVVADLEGYDLRPDPLQASTPAEFVEAMRRYRRWAGQPSFQQMAHDCGHLSSASSFHAMLGGNELPRYTLLNAFVIACGGDEAEFQRWATAWRRIDQGTLGRRPPLIALPPSGETS